MRAPPQNPAHRVGEPAAQLNNMRVARAPKTNRPLPVALNLAVLRAAVCMVGRAPRPRGRNDRLVEFRPLVV
eukprot:scaffold13155_cov138-Isochrysis_galbana.AAC.4